MKFYQDDSLIHFCILLVVITYYNNQRNNRKLIRSAILPPCLSPFRKLFIYGCIFAFKIPRYAFQMILESILAYDRNCADARIRMIGIGIDSFNFKLQISDLKSKY